MRKKVILTGDRATGALHLGHYVGSLKARVELQETHHQNVLIADAQALTDNYDNPQKVRDSVLQVMLDYLAVGIDPEKTTIILQTAVPEIQELAFYLTNMTTVGRLERNPTLKTEISARGFEKSLPVGFFIYPISQAADITAFRGELVPVGEDQKPMIELCNEIVDRFNRLYNCTVLNRCEAMISKVGRLAGTDGKEKMSKSAGNAILLGESADELKKKVLGMFTDPNHIRVEDPGETENNPVFMYLRVFDPDQSAVAELEAHYKRGGLGDMKVKQRLNTVLQDFIGPIRERRERFAKDPAQVMEILKKGTERGRVVASEVITGVKAAMGINYF